MKSGLAFKLSAVILTCVAAIFLGILAYVYSVSSDMMLKSVQRRARLLAESTVYRMQSAVLPLEKAVQNIAYSLEQSELDGDEVMELSRRIVSTNSGIFGAAVAFEPFAHSPRELYFAPYHYREGTHIVKTQLGGDDYNYFLMDWYQLPKVLGQDVWTEPYYDSGGGNSLMTTYSVPFYREVDGHEQFTGVVTADVGLKELSEVVSSIRIFETGYAYLISQNGTYITHPDTERIMNDTIFTVAETRDDPELREIGRKMVAGETGLVETTSLSLNRPGYLYYAPLPANGWSLGVFIPRDEMLADVTTLSRDMMVLGALGLVVLLGCISLIARSVTRPLTRLSETAGQIAGGNLDIELPTVKSRDEVGELTRSFSGMRDSLKEYISNLTSTTAAKERIESELRIARDIQMGILPKLFPAFPEKDEFDIFAYIEPAKEVGGDLYDFFFIDENHFCFLIGDVSGKGVPAAFFMAVTKTLLKATAEHGLAPGYIVTKVNDDLAQENESCMFVTLFVAIMDIRTGEMNYTSAGHNPPYVLRKDGKVEMLPPSGEPVAGVMEGMEYSSFSLSLEPGETIFLYTDGVTEAMDDEKTLYSEDRLEAHLATCDGQPSDDIIHCIYRSIKDFTGGAEQSDDITMLALQYRGKNS